jgi:hypothetical protein
MLHCYNEKYEELHRMQSAAPPYLALLLVRGLSTILLVGGLGVEDKPNGACEVPLVLYVILFFWH